MTYRDAPDSINEMFKDKKVYVEAKAYGDVNLFYSGIYEGVGVLNGHSMVILRDGHKHNREGIVFEKKKSQESKLDWIDFKKTAISLEKIISIDLI